MKASIQKRLRASINIDAINGNREERAICQSQMYEAANTIETLQSENATLKADLAALREVEREKVAAWILSFGFATGHGDTIEDLLSEAGTQIQELRAAQEWVPVSERLPDNGVTVLIAGGCAYHLSHNGWFTLMGSDAHRRITWTVTHWMPLPLPPQPAQENAEDGV